MSKSLLAGSSTTEIFDARFVVEIAERFDTMKGKEMGALNYFIQECTKCKACSCDDNNSPTNCYRHMIMKNLDHQ
jgi:hypothetical protein